jgi:hypothetical protein
MPDGVENSLTPGVGAVFFFEGLVRSDMAQDSALDIP